MTGGGFFQDLAVLMATAGLAAAVFSRLGWPKALGYILAGVLMNGYTWGGCFLMDTDSTQASGQLGVVFLMFAMGLSFSPREMRKIRSVVLPAALFDTAVMVWLGYLLGKFVFGWSQAASVFLGVAICDSATTLLAKVLDEMGWERRPFAKYVLGTSVCEDIVCVGALAVATGFAGGGSMSAGAFFASLGRLGAFFLAVLVLGFVFVPRLLKSVARHQDDEALLLTALGCCFFITFIAESRNCSYALGAFLIGVIAGSSDVRDRIERLVDPLKSMFSAVFFISIGLVVDPAGLWHCLPQILLVSFIVVAGKFFNNALASLAAGVSPKCAIQNGFALAQIGEFALMVTLIYETAVERGASLFPIAVGASLLTTLLNPFLIRLSDPAGDWVERHLPHRVHAALAAYRTWLDRLKGAGGSSGFAALRTPAIRLGVYAVLLLAVSVVSKSLHTLDYSRFSRFVEAHDESILFSLATLFAMALFPLILSTAKTLATAVARLLVGERTSSWAQPAQQMIAFVVQAAVAVLFFLEWFMIMVALMPKDWLMRGLVVALILVVGYCGKRSFTRAAHRATARFNEALTAEERRVGLAKMLMVEVPAEEIHQLVLAPGSCAVGGTVVTLDIRARTGASVVSVIRAGRVTRNIGPEWRFQAGDTLVALGTHDQIDALRKLLEV